MKYKLAQLILLFVMFAACNKKNNLDTEFQINIDKYIKALKSKDINRISEITNDQGLTSLLVWSDSLENNSFLNGLIRDLETENIFSVDRQDSVIVLSLGKENKIIGATGGYLFLKREGHTFIINEFRGGK